MREFDESPPSGAEVKNEWNYTTMPPTRSHYVDRSNITDFFAVRYLQMIHENRFLFLLSPMFTGCINYCVLQSFINVYIDTVTYRCQPSILKGNTSLQSGNEQQSFQFRSAVFFVTTAMQPLLELSFITLHSKTSFLSSQKHRNILVKYDTHKTCQSLMGPKFSHYESRFKSQSGALEFSFIFHVYFSLSLAL